MALVVEVRKSREGALGYFEAEGGIYMADVIFYAVLKSLDTMSEMLALGYRDLPFVFTELVKFLSLNASVEAVEKLET